MASKTNLPASLLRTYTSVLARRTAQLQSSATRILGLAPQITSNDAVRQHFENVTRRIQGLNGGLKLQAIPVRSSYAQRRWHSTDHLPKNKNYDFEDVLAILEQPSASQLLIDVREPHEYEKNTIPTAINLPVTSQPDALLLNEEDFEDRFGFAKPPLNKEVVFFCKAGVRSSAAAGIAREAGYENIGEYRGSWLDWERRGGPGTKTPNEPGGMGEPKAPITETKP